MVTRNFSNHVFRYGTDQVRMKIKQAVARAFKKKKEKEVWQESTAVVYRLLMNKFQRIVHVSRLTITFQLLVLTIENKPNDIYLSHRNLLMLMREVGIYR